MPGIGLILTSYDSNVDSTAPKTVGLPITLEVMHHTKRYENIA
jgi:hypothetical protein